MEQKIREALAKLDTQNDDHWTAEGLPRLDVMKDMVGEAVSRADITNAAKGFTRKTPNLEIEKPESTGTGEAVDAQATTPTEAQDVQAPATQDKDQEGEGGDGEEDLEPLEGDEAVEQELKDATANYHDAQKRLRKAQADMDVVTQRRTREAAKVSDSHTIKAYQKSQNEQRQRQAQRQRLMAEAMAATREQY